MTIQKRLLLLFGVFGVLPLLAIGVFDYVRSARAVDSLLARQTGAIASRALDDLRPRVDSRESDLLLLANNVETQRWLQAVAKGPVADSSIRGDAEKYLADAMKFFGGTYSLVRIVPLNDNPPIAFGGDSADVSLIERRPIVGENHERIGTLEYVPSSLESALRASPLAAAFGSDGMNLVYDRDRDLLIFSSVAPPGVLDEALVMLREHRTELSTVPGSLRYGAGRKQRIASYSSFESPSWTVVATASLEEFGGPVIRTRIWDLALLAAVASGLVIAFVTMLRRVTNPLAALTLAADRVTSGDLSPALPAASNDEVGRLSTAFRVMLRRIGEMIRQVESNRQMAVLGEFAAQLSHEIRNPLTAVKINLQGLERDAGAGSLSVESKQSVEIALREVQRLDTVVHGVLRMAHAEMDSAPFALHSVVENLVLLIGPQATRNGVHVTTSLMANDDHLTGDVDAMRSALLNVLLNAVEAQPAGGTIEISTSSSQHDEAPAIELIVHDGGAGITADQRERIFQPFYSTKPNGTGLGLPIALRVVRAHGGTLSIDGCAAHGTDVRIVLPLTVAAVPT